MYVVAIRCHFQLFETDETDLLAIPFAHLEDCDIWAAKRFWRSYRQPRPIRSFQRPPRRECRLYLWFAFVLKES